MRRTEIQKRRRRITAAKQTKSSEMWKIYFWEFGFFCKKRKPTLFLKSDFKKTETIPKSKVELEAGN